MRAHELCYIHFYADALYARSRSRQQTAHKCAPEDHEQPTPLLAMVEDCRGSGKHFSDSLLPDTWLIAIDDRSSRSNIHSSRSRCGYLRCFSELLVSRLKH